MRNKIAEEKLMNVARNYCQKMSAQKNVTHTDTLFVDTKENTPEKFEEKSKRRLNFTSINEKINLKHNKYVEEMDNSEIRTPDRPSHTYNRNTENSEYTQSSQNSKQRSHRTRQLKIKSSHCVTSHCAKSEDKSETDDMEEVIYSERESFEGYQYPNNTWDSDDSLYKEEYLSEFE